LIPRLLIVGGTGFIGSKIVSAAVKQGFECTVLSLNPPKVDTKLTGVNYLQADLVDRSQAIHILSRRAFDYVVNLAGYIDHSKFCRGGRKIIDVHFVGLLNLLESLDLQALKGFIQVGSSDEYGDLPAPQFEDMRESPISPYSVAKTASTHLLQMLSKTENFPVVIARLFLVYGEGQDNKRFLPQIIQGCLKDREFSVSLGEQFRDFCHVDDIAQGILAMLRAKNVHGKVLNLASGYPITIRAMIEKVRGIIGFGKPLFGKNPYRVGENMALYASMKRTQNLLGWKPSIELDEGLHRTIEFYRDIYDQ